MSEFRVAERYAKSIIGLAQERNELDAVHKDMLLLKETCEVSRPFSLMLKNPVISNDKKESIIKATFGSKVTELTNKFFDIVCKKGRASVLEAVAGAFHNQYNIINGIQSAVLTTAAPISDALRSEFVSVVKEISGKEVELKEEIDKDLIGGFVLKINDRMIDGSIQSRIRDLRLEFSDNPYISEI